MNPYAPPAMAPATAVAPAPLPPGMRRFRLARGPYLSLVRRIVIQRQAVVVAVFVLLLLYLQLLGLPSAPIWVFLGVWAFVATLTWLRQRAMSERQLAMFEIVVSPRVVRRIMPLLAPAEMLRPEVARIVETRRALSLVSTSPRRTLSITRTIDGYDALRAEIATWGPIETLRGPSAFAFAWGQLRHMGPRDRIEGTALANDPSLLEELTMVRAVGADAGHGYGRVIQVRRRLLVIAVLWVLLIGMYLAIWQLFSEPKAPPPSPPARGLHVEAPTTSARPSSGLAG